ncbi:restriction endonuclease subunit S [Gimesia sp.]|uniref:restriction endonuclease subunit S n=1 Tax=Gimesia sp. TaxID=2024833 RepID=UPI0032EC6E9E
MSFPKYAGYKNSGIEWLDEIPEHWDVKELKYACSNFPSNVDKKTIEGQQVVSLCNYTDVYYNEQITTGMQLMKASATDEQIEKFTLRAGDVIITKDSESADDIAVSTYIPADLPGVVCGYHLAMIRPKEGVSGLFIKRLFDSVYIQSKVATLANGLTRMGLSHASISGLELPIPPAEEQTAIANFLDAETAKIDALVSEQQRLIELLKEKRQAVISHAVTKGLNPDAHLKDSGIEWLGKVPEDWSVKLLRRFSCKVQTGPFGSQLHADEYVPNGTPVINPTHMVNGKIVPSDDIRVTDEVLERLPHQRLEAGDVIFSRRGELGRCALVTEREAGWLCGTGSMILRLHKSEYIGGYLSLFLSLDILRQYFESFSIGSVMNSLSSETLLSMPLIVPPINEQQRIVDYVAEKVEFIESLVEETVGTIELLQERRTALISAAVTGKIDVREYAAQETA